MILNIDDAGEGANEPLDYLSLADWRRRVSDLYTKVRAVARDDPRAAWDDWRSTRESLYREHPQSPVPDSGRAAFRSVHFDYDPGLRFELPVVVDESDPSQSSSGLELPVSAGGTMTFSRIGWLDVPLAARSGRLALYWMAGYAGGLFLPFRDATNGNETYGAGRYLLDAAKSADLGGDPDRGTLVIDFNFSFQPSCAFDPKWACPLAPRENWLDIPLRAGERLA
jgi:uncharacterized protein